jgi:hypothetical protein
MMDFSCVLVSGVEVLLVDKMSQHGLVYSMSHTDEMSQGGTVPARESERSLEKYNKNRFKRFLFKL